MNGHWVTQTTVWECCSQPGARAVCSLQCSVAPSIACYSTLLTSRHNLQAAFQKQLPRKQEAGPSLVLRGARFESSLRTDILTENIRWIPPPPPLHSLAVHHYKASHHSMLCILRRRHPGAHITPLILAASEEHYNVHTTFTETLTTEYNHEDLASLPRPLQYASPSLPSRKLTVKISQSAPSTSQPVPITQQSSSVFRPSPASPSHRHAFIRTKYWSQFSFRLATPRVPNSVSCPEYCGPAGSRNSVVEIRHSVDLFKLLVGEQLLAFWHAVP